MSKMNLPNKLTIFRVILIVPFIILLLGGQAGWFGENTFVTDMIALAIFIIASLTDLIDGKIARKYNLITDFGKFLDPIADKLLVFSALLLFLDFGTVTVWSVFIILFGELLVSALRMVASAAGVVVAADKLGKYKTATTMVSICGYLCVFAMAGLQLGPVSLLLGVYSVSRFLYVIAVILTIVSGAQYFWNCRKIVFSV